jgi:hypothetical protein
MMQPCASAAKLRGGGPILRSGLGSQGGIRVTATSDRHQNPTTTRSSGCFLSSRRTQCDADWQLPGVHKAPQLDEQLAC